MELAAIIVVDVRPEDLQAAASHNGHGPSFPEHFAGMPLSLLSVVGKPIVCHAAEYLRAAGVQAITIITHEKLRDMAPIGASICGDAKWVPTTDAWKTAAEEFSRYADEGAENVLISRSGPYTEINVQQLLEFHLQQHQHATSVEVAGEVLDIAMVAACRRHDAAFLLNNRLRKTLQPSRAYVSHGYLNHLKKPHDFRRLVRDALLMRCQIKPAGEEIKPGVWVGDHARIHRSVRLLAPAFVGAFAKLRAGTVVTSCAAIEDHAEVDCGPVVEDKTVLPYSYVGRGLDVAHAVVGQHYIAHLPLQAQVEIADPRLLSTLTTSPSWRTIQNAASLAGFLPLQMARGLVGVMRRNKSNPVLSTDKTTCPETPRPAGDGAERERFSAELAVVRRYGNE